MLISSDFFSPGLNDDKGMSFDLSPRLPFSGSLRNSCTGRSLSFRGVTLRLKDYHGFSTLVSGLTRKAKPWEFAPKPRPDWSRHRPKWRQCGSKEALPREAGEENMLRSFLLRGSTLPGGWKPYPQLGRQASVPTCHL